MNKDTKDPLQIHAALQSINVNEATLYFDNNEYYYINLGNNEFQFGKEGDMPTNYIVE